MHLIAVGLRVWPYNVRSNNILSGSSLPRTVDLFSRECCRLGCRCKVKPPDLHLASPGDKNRHCLHRQTVFLSIYQQLERKWVCTLQRTLCQAVKARSPLASHCQGPQPQNKRHAMAEQHTPASRTVTQGTECHAQIAKHKPTNFSPLPQPLC